MLKMPQIFVLTANTINSICVKDEIRTRKKFSLTGVTTQPASSYGLQSPRWAVVPSHIRFNPNNLLSRQSLQPHRFTHHLAETEGVEPSHRLPDFTVFETANYTNRCLQVQNTIFYNFQFVFYNQCTALPWSVLNFLKTILVPCVLPIGISCPSNFYWCLCFFF